MRNHKFSLGNVFQNILYRIDDWINEWSGWIDELVESQYIDISTYRPLSGSSGSQVGFPVQEKDFSKIKTKNKLPFPI